jgi:mRNA interferase RelE/StbE
VKYNVQLTAEAEAELKELPSKIQRQILDKLHMLEEDPRARGKKLKGYEAYRLSTGDYRMVYEVEDSPHHVVVFLIGNRKDIYKKKLC